MSLFEDDRPKKPTTHEIGADLTFLSLDELNQRIALLREEISRIEAECASKASGRSAAENLFRR